MTGADLAALVYDADPAVAAAALASQDKTGQLSADAPALWAAANPEQPLHPRAAAARIAENHPNRTGNLLAKLAYDPQIFIRAYARKISAANVHNH